MVNRMPTQKQFREAELQLAEALTDADRKNGLINNSRDCLSAEQLRQFAVVSRANPMRYLCTWEIV